MKGWTLGPEWEIGPATVSSGHSGNKDPALDHSPTADNQLAGVLIGGYNNNTVHGFYYLESPVVDTAAADTVYLRYWRWHNSDYINYMESRVEVFDGVSWVVVWVQPSGGVYDNAWNQIAHDITAYKNANMHVRFGFNIKLSAVFKMSGWNLDDVGVVSGADCYYI